MGIPFDFVRGEGPAIEKPLRREADLDARARRSSRATSSAYVLEAIRQIKAGARRRVPLIGFAGAPFTLASYAIEGGHSNNFAHTKSLMYGHPGRVASLLRPARRRHRRLSRRADRGRRRLRAGVRFVGRRAERAPTIASSSCRTRRRSSRVSSAARRADDSFRRRHRRDPRRAARAPAATSSAPTGARRSTRRGSASAPTAASRAISIRRCCSARSIAMFAATDDVLARAGGRPGHIFNLGHGILPTTPVEHVQALARHVHQTGTRIDRIRAGPSNSSAAHGIGAARVLLMAHGTPSSLDEMPEYLRLVRGGRPPSAELVAEMRHNYERDRRTLAAHRHHLAQAAALRARLGGRTSRSPSACATGGRSSRTRIAELAAGGRHAHHRHPDGAAVFDAERAEIPRRGDRGAVRPASRSRQSTRYHAHPLLLDAFAERVRAAQPGARRARDLHGAQPAASASSTPAIRTPTRSRPPRAASPSASGSPTTSSRTRAPAARPSRGSARTLDRADRRALASASASFSSVPIGFVCDHTEILFDIDVQAAQVAREFSTHAAAHRVAEHLAHLHRHARGSVVRLAELRTGSPTDVRVALRHSAPDSTRMTSSSSAAASPDWRRRTSCRARGIVVRGARDARRAPAA